MCVATPTRLPICRHGPEPFLDSRLTGSAKLSTLFKLLASRTVGRLCTPWEAARESHIDDRVIQKHFLRSRVGRLIKSQNKLCRLNIPYRDDLDPWIYENRDWSIQIDVLIIHYRFGKTRVKFDRFPLLTFEKRCKSRFYLRKIVQNLEWG